MILTIFFRRRSIKRQEMKDHRLLPEQSEKISTKKLLLTNSVRRIVFFFIQSNIPMKIRFQNLSIQMVNNNNLIKEFHLQHFHIHHQI